MGMAVLSCSLKKVPHRDVRLPWHVCDALVPLLKQLLPLCKQVWFADDATGCDDFLTMRKWFDTLVENSLRLFPKPSKCILLAKPDRVDLALKIFKGSGIDIQTEGAK